MAFGTRAPETFPIDYTLGANVENLSLTGADDINGTGNSRANSIEGNDASNRLSGLGGGEGRAEFGADDEGLRCVLCHDCLLT